MSITRSMLVSIAAMAMAVTSPSIANDEPSSSQTTIAAVSVEFSEEGFTGPGGEILREGLEQAQFHFRRFG